MGDLVCIVIQNRGCNGVFLKRKNSIRFIRTKGVQRNKENERKS